MTTTQPAAGPNEPLDLERLYAESFPRVYGFALRMLGDREAAADVAQDVFTTAVARAGTFRGESAPLTWLLSIARNICLRRLEHARTRRFEDFEAVMAQAEEPSTGRSAGELRFYIDEVKEGCLIGLLQCLPLSQRSVFVLHLLSDVPIADVATIMGKSENSIRILLSRARSKMRDFLCQNCAYLGGSRCSCLGMVEFSLARNLVAKYRPHHDIVRLAAEVRHFSNEVELYRSLPEHEDAIARLMASGRYAIFSTE